MKTFRLPKALPQIMMFVMAGGAACAQNSDFTVLLGVIGPSAQTDVSAPGVVVRADAGAALQINYAYQLKGWQAGDLYLEVPLFLAFRGGVIRSTPDVSSVKATGMGAVT